MSFTNSNRRRRNDQRNASSSSRSHSMNDTDISQTNEQNPTTSRGVFYFQGTSDSASSTMSNSTQIPIFHSTSNSSLNSLSSPFQQSPSTRLENTHRPITRSISKRQHQTNDPSSNSSPSTSSSSSSNCLFTASLSSLLDQQTLQAQEQQKSMRSLLNSFQSELLKLQNVPTYQKVLVNEKPCNIINVLENRRMNGRMINTFSNLPDKTLGHLGKRLNTHDYPMLIKKLDLSSVIINLNKNSTEFKDLLKLLDDIENRLMNYKASNVTDAHQMSQQQSTNGDQSSLNESTGDEQESEENTTREEFEIETINKLSARVFRQYGGIQIFKRILLMNILVDSASNSTSSSESENKNPTNPNNNTLSPNEFKKSLNSFKYNKLPCSSSSLKLKSLPLTAPFLSFNRSQTTSSSLNGMTSASLSQTASASSTNDGHKQFVYNLENNFILKIKRKCIHILNRLICLPSFGKLVVNDLLQYKANEATTSDQTYDTHLLQYLFTLLMLKDCRLQACQLIESILLHIPMLNLNRINNIRFILERIDNEGLSCICKIFAVTLSNLDFGEKKYLAMSHSQTLPNATSQLQQQQQAQQQQQQQQQTKRNQKLKDEIQQKNQLSVRDQNQELLLSIPTLLFRLVNLIKRKEYATRFEGASSEIEHWIRYIDEALSDNSDNELDDDTLHQPALLTANKLNNFVYVLYTLSLLLIGKEKKKVQKALTKLRLASALNALFDYLIWNCRCESNNVQSQQAQQQQQQQQIRSHICPEVAVKIQFLRLVHSFCDHSEYKRVILSKEENEEILKYNNEAPSILKVNENTIKVDNRLRCTNDKVGLLSKIVTVIKQEPFSASFRFWLIRAIESFLRGGTSYSDQMFLINRGVVEDIVQNILAINFTRPKEVLQSCFDMLGELIKFNVNGFQLLDKELNETDKFNMFLTMINQSLIDSNMFLRSVFLSLEFFDLKSSLLEFDLNSNRILVFFGVFERRVSFICRMMSIINIHNLSQENISCLNTTLIVLMLANKRNILPEYLRAIKSKSIDIMLNSELFHFNRNDSSTATNSSRDASSASSDLITNLRDLLVFWQIHYLQKDKDCFGLEQNSRIEFAYWKHTVELLLDSNKKNECSLSYYMHNDFNSINNRNRIDEYRSD